MESVDFLYTEYVRLNTLVDAYANSLFSDFKLLGAVGLMLAWEPFATRISGIKSDDKDSTWFVFMGFVAIFFVIAIIASRALMKQSIIAFQISQIAHFEQAIRIHVDFNVMKTFNSANEWKYWLKNVHMPVANCFRGLVFVLAIAFPCLVLWRKGKKFSFLYLGIVGIVTLVYVYAGNILLDAIEG